MHLQGCRLMAGCLADHHRLNEVTDDRHQAPLGLLVGIVAREEQQLPNGDLRIGRIELRFELCDLFLEVLRWRLRAGNLQDQFLARYFQFIELVVQDGEARAAFGMTFLDLLHQARLLRFDFCELGSYLIRTGGDALQLVHLMGNHLLRNPVEDVDAVEGNGDTVKHALLEFVPGDRLAVPAAGAAKLINRQALLAVRAAIAILARDSVGAAAFFTFQHAAQEVFRPVCCIEPVALTCVSAWNIDPSGGVTGVQF
ncbi:hypothetical protein LJR239_003423 [Neorhizobium tomejilense]